VLGVSASALGPMLAACGSSGSSGTSAGGAARAGTSKKAATGISGITSPASDVDPVTMFNTGAIMTTQLACDYLVFPDPQYKLIPKLATKWESGSTPDTWTFTIRQGVKWQDGSAFTNDDIVASFDRMLDPKIGSAALSAFSGVLSRGNVESTGADTI